MRNLALTLYRNNCTQSLSHNSVVSLDETHDCRSCCKLCHKNKSFRSYAIIAILFLSIRINIRNKSSPLQSYQCSLHYRYKLLSQIKRFPMEHLTSTMYFVSYKITRILTNKWDQYRDIGEWENVDGNLRVSFRSSYVRTFAIPDLNILVKYLSFSSIYEVLIF